MFRPRSRTKTQQKHKTNSEFWLHNHFCLLIMARSGKLHGRSVPVRRSFFAFCPRKIDKAGGGEASGGYGHALPSLAPPAPASSIFLLSLQFTRGQYAEKPLRMGAPATRSIGRWKYQTPSVHEQRSEHRVFK